MKLRYAIKEAISGFKKSRLSSFASIFVLFISLFSIGVFITAGYNFNRLIKSIKEKIEIEVFIKDGISQSHIDSLRNLVKSMSEVEEVIYISKDEAAKIFKKEFGEDIFSVLDFNPLPASLKIKLKEKFRSSDGIRRVIGKLGAIQEFEDIKYRKSLLYIIERRFRLLSRAFLLGGVLLSLISILLIINTIRLTIYAKRKLIGTMQLVGATRGFIMFPFLIQGFLQGLIGGLCSALVIYISVEVIVPQLPDDLLSAVEMPFIFYPALVFLGCVLGFVGSWISARKYITYKII